MFTVYEVIEVFTNHVMDDCQFYCYWHIVQTEL